MHMYVYVSCKKLCSFLANLSLFFVVTFKVQFFCLVIRDVIKCKPTTQVGKELLLNLSKAGRLLCLGCINQPDSS